MLRTTTKKFTDNFKSYVWELANPEQYDMTAENADELLALEWEMFKREMSYEIQRFGVQEAFIYWTDGQYGVVNCEWIIVPCFDKLAELQECTEQEKQALLDKYGKRVEEIAENRMTTLLMIESEKAYRKTKDLI